MFGCTDTDFASKHFFYSIFRVLQDLQTASVILVKRIFGRQRIFQKLPVWDVWPTRAEIKEGSRAQIRNRFYPRSSVVIAVAAASA